MEQCMQCIYCHKSISIKLLDNPNAIGFIIDDKDVNLQQDLHLAEEPGCAALHRVMSEGDGMCEIVRVAYGR